MPSGLQIPDSAPVMVLPHCNFFPNTPLPLHIFEPRYRTMLALVLEGERMFCVGTAVDGDDSDPELPFDHEAGIYRHGTLGLVRACVQAEDGTSNLILEGLRRVRFARWERETPFRIASLEEVPTVVNDPEEVAMTATKVVALVSLLVERGFRQPPQLDLERQSEVAPDLLVDVVGQYFVTDLDARHHLLALETLEDRLDLLTELLKGELGALGPPPV